MSLNLLRADDFAPYDIALDGVGMGVAWSEADDPYVLLGPDLHIERQDFSEELSQNRLDSLFWAGLRSFHGGAGLLRFGADPQNPYGEFRFAESRGIDITTKGKATLLNTATRILSLTGFATIRMAQIDTHVYVGGSGSTTMRRFSTVNASDVATITTGTETAQGVFDLASDGSLVYAALGPDGIHRTKITEDVLIDDFSGGWTVVCAATNNGTCSHAFSGGALTLSATAQTSAATTVSFTITKTGVWDFSRADNIIFTVHVHHAQGVPDEHIGIPVRFYSSDSDYFEITVTADGVRTTQPSQYASVGSPSWATITKIIFLPTITVNAGQTSSANTLDDVKWTATGSINLSHWSDADARVVAYVKDRVMAAGKLSGSAEQWRIYEASGGKAVANSFILPQGWQVSAITELGRHVYFAAYRGSLGAVWAWDGETYFRALSPFTLNGDTPIQLVNFEDAGLLVGCRRSTSGAGYKGLLLRAFPKADGTLAYEAVLEHGADDGVDYGVAAGFSWGDVSYFGWNRMEAGVSGLGVYIPETGGYARHIEATVAGVVTAGVVWKGRRMFAIANDGIWAEGTTCVGEGYVVSPRADVGVAADKVWLELAATYRLEGQDTVDLEYSTDGGTTWVAVTGDRTTGRLSIHLADDELRTAEIAWRAKLKSANSGADCPELTFAGIGGWPATKPQLEHIVVVRAYPDQQNRVDLSSHRDDQGHELLAALVSRWRAGLPLAYQPPWWRIDHAAVWVRIAEIRALGPWGTTGEAQGGLVRLRLKEVGAL